MTDIFKHLTKCFKCKRHFCTDEKGTIAYPYLPDTFICCNHSPDTTIKKMEVIEPIEIKQIPARTHRIQWSNSGLDRLEAGLSKRQFEESFDEVFGEEEL